VSAPTVSVAIRAFRRQWLGEAIESALGQTYRDLELVVYDDAGDLEDFVAGYDDPRIRYHRAQEKLGESGRFNAATALCRGRYIGVLDDDDRYEPEFVERLVAALEADPTAGIAFCRVVYLVDGPSYVDPDPRPAGPQPNAVRQIVGFREFIPPSVMLMRRAALDEAMAHRTMPDGVAPDVFVNVHVGVTGWRHVLVREPLSVRRWHPDQLSLVGHSMARVTASTWRQLAVGDEELERVRRRILAQRLIWTATYELEAGNRGMAKEDLAAAAAADSSSWPVPRRLARLATSVPVAGQVAAWAALRLIRLRRRRLPPPSLVR
jgi:glycosyltransferase involved in cell wall biosynthesis